MGGSWLQEATQQVGLQAAGEVGLKAARRGVHAAVGAMVLWVALGQNILHPTCIHELTAFDAMCLAVRLMIRKNVRRMHVTLLPLLAWPQPS